MAGSDRPGWPSRPTPDYHPADSVDWEDDDAPYPPPSPQPTPSGTRSRSRRNLLWRWRRGLFVVGLLVMAMFAAAVAVVAQVKLPQAEELQLSSYICAADVAAGNCSKSTAVAKLSQEEDRDYVQLEDIPQVVVDAVISAEDRGFFEHDGIDPAGIGRALYRDLRGGGVSQGGSTITQQYVKQTYLSSERSLSRKIKEAVLAIKVEQRMSKEEILEGYLNTIYWGRNTYGIQAASRGYFKKDVQEIGLQEAAYLASLIRAPGSADAAKPEQLAEASRRRQTVLDAMLEEGYIDQAQHDMVSAIDLTSYVNPRESYRLTTTYWGMSPDGVGPNQYGMEYITAYIQSEVKKALMSRGYDETGAEAEIAAGGLRIYSTIDLNMQPIAYDSVYRNTLVDPATDPSAGMVAIDGEGYIRAMVGGRDITAQNSFAQNNFAVGNSVGRQVGSTFKPIALAAALQDGVSPEKTHLPAPAEREFPPGGQNPCDHWTAHNYSSEDPATGSLDLFQATAESSNTAFAGLMAELGPPKVIDMAGKLGMDNTDMTACLPTVLGSEGSSPLEMAEVYSTFANRGIHREPTIITRIDKVDKDGVATPLWVWEKQEQQVLTQTTADLVTEALVGVIDHGTGHAANIDKPAAGKTGTTSFNRDAWFVGYTPGLTAAVWMGYPEKQTLPDCNPDLAPDPEDPDTCAPQIPPMQGILGRTSITGGSIPAEIWQKFMVLATAGQDAEFVMPTPEQARSGRQLGDGGGYSDETTTTIVDEPSDPNPSSTTSSPQNSTTSTTENTDPPIPPSFPFPTTTSTTRPRPGGGGGSPP